MPAKKAKKSALPSTASRRLKPFIDKGIANGVFVDDSTVVNLWRSKAQDGQFKENIAQLGGLKNELAQNFVTDLVLVDLSSILRRKRYNAHLDIWEVNHRTVGAAKGNPRPACFIIGQAVIEDDGGATMESAIFRMSLWDEDTALADDVESDGHYVTAVTTRKGGLDADILDLQPLQGLTNFTVEKFDHGDRAELLKEMYEITPIAELDDNLSRTPTDFRLVEAMVSFSGVQNSRAGNQFGKMLLKDDSTMTMEAIESGENLLLNAITSSAVVSRFGKYSRILALCTIKDNGQYGLSANIETAVGLVVVEPPKATVTETKDEDDAASYFSTSTPAIVVGDDDDDDDEEEAAPEAADAPEAPADPEPKEEAPEAPEEEEAAPTEEADGSDDDWDDWD
jgi:hypothetical protein